MILVTLGTQDKDFSRLLKAIEKQITDKVIKEKVVVQAGHTNFKSKHMEIFDYIPMDEFEKLMKECSILITHGGVGSIISGISKDKPVIAAARLEKYKEHTNDHQEQIIEEFAKEGYILELKDFDKLDEVYKKSKTFKAKKYKSNTKNMVKLLDEYIDENSHANTNKYLSFIVCAVVTLLVLLLKKIFTYAFFEMKLVVLLYWLPHFLRRWLVFIFWIATTFLSYVLIKNFAFKNKGWNQSIVEREIVSFFAIRGLLFFLGNVIDKLYYNVMWNYFGGFGIRIYIFRDWSFRVYSIYMIIKFVIYLLITYTVSRDVTFKENK